MLPQLAPRAEEQAEVQPRKEELRDEAREVRREDGRRDVLPRQLAGNVVVVHVERRLARTRSRSASGEVEFRRRGGRAAALERRAEAELDCARRAGPAACKLRQPRSAGPSVRESERGGAGRAGEAVARRRAARLESVAHAASCRHSGVRRNPCNHGEEAQDEGRAVVESGDLGRSRQATSQSRPEAGSSKLRKVLRRGGRPRHSSPGCAMSAPRLPGLGDERDGQAGERAERASSSPSLERVNALTSCCRQVRRRTQR